MSDRSSQPKPIPATPAVIGKVKEGTNDPELQAEGEAIDSAISSVSSWPLGGNC